MEIVANVRSNLCFLICPMDYGSVKLALDKRVKYGSTVRLHAHLLNFYPAEFRRFSVILNLI